MTLTPFYFRMFLDDMEIDGDWGIQATHPVDFPTKELARAYTVEQANGVKTELEKKYPGSVVRYDIVGD